MGCSSSALNRTSDNSKCRSVTSNECLPTTEENESCFVQPKPRKMGKESTFYGNVERESHPPSQKLKMSAASTANGVKSLHEQPLTSTKKDVADQPGAMRQELAIQPPSTQKAQLLEQLQESGPPRSDGKDDTSGAEEKKDVEAMMVPQTVTGHAEATALGTEAEGQALRMVEEESSPGTVEGTEIPQAASAVKPLGTFEKIQPLETAEELQPQEAEKKDQPQNPETVFKENEASDTLDGSQKSGEPAGEQHLQETKVKHAYDQLFTTPPEKEVSETLEGSQSGETAGEQHLQETEAEDEYSELLETIPKESEASQEPVRSQLVETAVQSDVLHKAPDVLGSMEESQAEGTIRNGEHPADVEAEAEVERTMGIDTTKEDQHIEGETGEKVEMDVENEKVIEGAETKEEETGESVDPSAAT